MTPVVFPGQEIIFSVQHLSLRQPSPCFALVQVVRRGSIMVFEPESINGLANIECHSNSANDGSYTYDYIDIRGDRKAYPVVRLEAKGEPIRVGSFISD